MSASGEIRWPSMGRISWPPSALMRSGVDVACLIHCSSRPGRGFAIDYESMSEQHQDLGGRLVKVAYAQTEAEAEMIQGLLKGEGIPSVLQALGINGPLLGVGLLVKNPQRVMVRTDQAERASALLAETVVDEQGFLSESADADHLEDASGRKSRDYGPLGAYGRAYFWSGGIIAVTFGIFLLLRAG